MQTLSSCHGDTVEEKIMGVGLWVAVVCCSEFGGIQSSSLATGRSRVCRCVVCWSLGAAWKWSVASGWSRILQRVLCLPLSRKWLVKVLGWEEGKLAYLCRPRDLALLLAAFGTEEVLVSINAGDRRYPALGRLRVGGTRDLGRLSVEDDLGLLKIAPRVCLGGQHGWFLPVAAMRWKTCLRR